MRKHWDTDKMTTTTFCRRRLFFILSIAKDFSPHRRFFASLRMTSGSFGPFPTKLGFFHLLLLVTMCLLAAGCQRRSDAIPVSGRITLGSSGWPKPGTIYFMPTKSAEGSPGRSGMAHFGPDGAFEVLTPPDANGLLPGKYRIAVECWIEEPTENPAGKREGVSAAPRKYLSPTTSGLEFEVRPDRKPLRADFDILTK